MPSKEPAAKVYKTTLEQRSKARDRRRALGIQPRPPADPQAARDRRNAQQRADYAAFEAAFIGPRRPRAGRCFHRRTAEAMAASAKQQHEQRKASFVGPPKPEAIAAAQRRAKLAEWHRSYRAQGRAEFVGPPKPLMSTRRARVVVPKTPKPPKVTQPRPDRSELAEQRDIERAGRAWDRQAVTLLRRVSKVVLRPVKAPRNPREALAAPRLPIDPPAIFGPPAPPRAILRETMRQEVAQAKAQAASRKAAAKAQATADLAAAKATRTAGKSWDREAVKLIRKTARYIREQVREAAQIAAKAVTPERRAASKAAYEAAMAAWDADVRRIADETRNAFRRRVDAEDERAKRSAAAALEAQSLLSSTVMRGPVRRTPLLRS